MNEIIIPLGGLAISAAIIGSVLRLCRFLTEPTAWHCIHCGNDFDRDWRPVTLDNPLVAAAALCPRCSERHEHALGTPRPETADGRGWTQMPTTAARN
jgi:DNA-directed RNA polymerase subunit RPC12/RpoP